MRISDWSSDVCSSDLIDRILRGVWDNLGRTVAEYPHLPKIWDYDPEHPTRAGRIEVAGVEEFVALRDDRSEEHTSELQSLMRSSYAVFCLKTKITET